MRRDSAHDSLPTRLHCLDRIRRSTMLQHNLQLGELVVDRPQRGQETRLGVHDGNVFLVVTGALAVDVEHEPFFLHGSEDGVKRLVAGHARLGVGRQALRVALDAHDAGLLGGADHVGRDALVEVERHEVGHGRVQGLEALVVGLGLGDGGHGGHEVGHHVGHAGKGKVCERRGALVALLLALQECDLLHTTLADGGHNGRRHGPISQVDMKVCRRWQLQLVRKRHVVFWFAFYVSVSQRKYLK